MISVIDHKGKGTILADALKVVKGFE